MLAFPTFPKEVMINPEDEEEDTLEPTHTNLLTKEDTAKEKETEKEKENNKE